MLELEDELKEVGFIIVRFKNYFKNLDPTHLRRYAFTVQCDLGNSEGYHFCEVQAILSPAARFKFEETKLMHEPYEFFRTLFKLKIDSELGSSTGWMSLTDRIQSWSSFIQEPVLMSLLIAVLDAFDFQEPKIELLPASRSELYQLAMAAVSDAKLVSTLG